MPKSRVLSNPSAILFRCTENCAGFDKTLDLGILPQMFVSLRRSGYRLLFVTAGEIKGFRRMDQFMGSPPFDEVISAGDLQLERTATGHLRSAKARLGGKNSQRCEPNSAFYHGLSYVLPFLVFFSPRIRHLQARSVCIPVHESQGRHAQAIHGQIQELRALPGG